MIDTFSIHILSTINFDNYLSLIVYCTCRWLSCNYMYIYCNSLDAVSSVLNNLIDFVLSGSVEKKQQNVHVAAGIYIHIYICRLISHIHDISL